jgi:hypothetical protein
MGDPRSPPETTDLLASFHTGYLKRISHQIVAMRAEQRSAMDSIRSTTDTHLVLTGQVLEAIRAMGRPTAPPSGPPGPWQTLKEYAQSFVLLTKVWSAMRSGPWGMLAWLGYGALKWVGLL